jgi:hypothetical protein
VPGRCAEDDILSLDRAGRSSGRGLVAPVQVRVRDHLLGRRRAPYRVVPGCVCIAHKNRVVASHERTVKSRADAGIGLCADGDESTDSEPRQHGLKISVLE